MSASPRYWTTVFVGLAASCNVTALALSARRVYFVHHPGGGSRAALAVQYYEPGIFEQLTLFLGTGVQDGGFGEKLRRMRLSNRFLAIFHALLLTVLTIGLAISWSTYEQGRGASFWSPQDGSAFPWSFERWNCAIAWSIEPARSAVSPTELLGLCRQARAARVLMLCASVLAGLALAMQLLVWRDQGRDPAWSGQGRSRKRSSQGSTIGAKEDGLGAFSLEERTAGEAEARGDGRN